MNVLKVFAKKGVIYTFYPKVTELMKKNGEIVDSKSVPAWIGKVLKDTDVKNSCNNYAGYWKLEIFCNN